MAFQNAEAIQKLYVAFFNRPADYYGLEYWDGVVTRANGSTAAVAAEFAKSKEYTDTFAGMDTRNVINTVYKNLFGRSADEAGLNYWYGEVQAGRVTIANAVTSIAAGAQNADKVAYASKVTAATAFTNALDTTDERLGYAGEKANAVAKQFVAGVTDAASLAVAITPANLDATVNQSIGAGQTATTYQLTKGLDNIPGTAGNDVIVASIDSTTGGNAELNTLSSVDVINGGAGVDTLKVNHASSVDGKIALGNLTSVEVVEINSAYVNTAVGGLGVDVDTTLTTGVTDLNIVRALDTIKATAGASTNVGVSLKDVAGIGSITVVGGKNVNVATTDSVSAINVGAATDADPTGAVTISATGAAVVNNAVDATTVTTTMGNITVGGGTTISVTQKAAVSTTSTVADGGKEAVVQGNVVIAANAATTDVTVKQDATISAQSRVAVAGVTESATAKFTALEANQSVTVGGLTFTAGKALTAAEVAQAFANLASTAVKPTQLGGTSVTSPATATGDTNGSSVASNGVFTGTLLANWSSSAAAGDTVTFTGRANTALANLELSSSGAAVTVTTTADGKAAVSAQNRLGITAGTVQIDGAAGLKTVTVDGYAASTGTAGINGGTNAALATITLANGAGFDIDSAAATLALNLTNVNGTVNIAAGTKTLNASVTSDATTTATLTSASAEAINVKGTGNVAGNTTAGLTAATAINTSAMTAGTATFTIANGTTTSYTGGAAADTVTITNGGTAITKAVTLGAGDDKLILNGTVVAPTATLSGGEGSDIISINGASAAALSANGDFAGKIDGFEKLEINDVVGATAVVNMANMDGINYVITHGSSTASSVTGNAQKYVFDIAGLQIDTGATLRIGGQTLFTATADDTAAAAIAAGVVSTVTINGVVYNVTTAGTQITLTSATNVAPQAAVSVSTTGTVDTPATNAGVTTTAGTADIVGGTPYLTIDKLAANGTVELVDTSAGVIVKLADATGTADVLNVVTSLDANLNFGTLTAAGVETIKINAVDLDAATSVERGTLTLNADKATLVTVAGSSHVTLNLGADTKSLATVDASTLAGNLTFTANSANSADVVAVTVTGGAGADILMASAGTNAKADVLVGGAGADVLYAGSNGAMLTGGAGNDLFIVGATSTTTGNKEINTYSTITDFAAGDLLQVRAFVSGAAADLTGFGKLTASLNETTASFSNFVEAAIAQANLGAAVWFNFKGDLYVVVDNGTTNGATFTNGEDVIVKLTGINGDNLTWNADYGTAALI